MDYALKQTQIESSSAIDQKSCNSIVLKENELKKKPVDSLKKAALQFDRQSYLVVIHGQAHCTVEMHTLRLHSSKQIDKQPSK